MLKLAALLSLIIFYMNANSAQELFSGNKRFLENQKLQQIRKENITTQSPIAIVVTCSDSRVSPEIIFDKSLGEIFVVRNAGNVIDEVSLASIEFAVDFFHIPLIVLMGHQNCAAVQEALNVTFEGLKANPESFNVVLKKIQPSLGKIDSADDINEAVIDNAIYQKKQLISKSALIRGKLRENKVQCLALYYDIGTGKVKLLDQ